MTAQLQAGVVVEEVARVALNWSEIGNTAIGGAIAALAGAGATYLMEWRRRVTERNDKAAATREERIAIGQSALMLLGLQLRTVAGILHEINPYRADKDRWHAMPNVRTPLVVTCGHLNIAPLMFLAMGDRATDAGGDLIIALGRSQELLDGAIETATGRRQPYEAFHAELASAHGNPIGSIEVPEDYFDGPLPVRLANAVAQLRGVTDGVYTNADLAYRRLHAAIKSLHAQLKLQFPDQRFPQPDAPEDPAAVRFD